MRTARGEPEPARSCSLHGRTGFETLAGPGRAGRAGPASRSRWGRQPGAGSRGGRFPPGTLLTDPRHPGDVRPPAAAAGFERRTRRGEAGPVPRPPPRPLRRARPPGRAATGRPGAGGAGRGGPHPRRRRRAAGRRRTAALGRRGLRAGALGVAARPPGDATAAAPGRGGGGRGGPGRRRRAAGRLPRPRRAAVRRRDGLGRGVGARARRGGRSSWAWGSATWAGSGARTPCRRCRPCPHPCRPGWPRAGRGPGGPRASRRPRDRPPAS